MRLTKLAPYLLLILGCLQPLGHFLKMDVLKGLGSAITASPLPVVFSDIKGVETFASQFVLDMTALNGERKSLPITPALYSKFRGPYNRRNVYGAAISYGPLLPEVLWKSVLQYGLCDPAPLARELGVSTPLQVATVHIKTMTAGRDQHWNLEVICNL